MSRANLPLPDGYPELLDELKRTVADTRWRAQRVVNTELISMYWRIGRSILDRLETEAYGTSVIDRLSEDLQTAFPDSRGSARAACGTCAPSPWPGPMRFGSRLLPKLPWGHIMVLLDKLDNPAERDWYAAQAVEHGWPRNVLLNQIMSGLHTRVGAAPSPTTVSLQPRLADIPRLVRDSGHNVTLDLRGVQGQDWTEPTQRAAYRTVQEALTNVSKHAPAPPSPSPSKPAGTPCTSP